jgi:hypothetical protein
VSSLAASDSNSQSLVYNPHLRQESDEALLKQAKYQAMGIAAPEKPHRRHNSDRPEMATDEAVRMQPSILINSHAVIGNGAIPEENEAMKHSLLPVAIHYITT